MRISELDTPVVVAELDRLEGNISRLQDYLNARNLKNRPHIKTHKIPEIAHMQVNTGAVGVTCQKLGEAEVMVEAGIRDILVPYNIVGTRKLVRLMSLARKARIKVTADSEAVVGGLSVAARREGLDIPVLVEFDTGHGRCGVQSPAAAATLARVVANSAHLKFAGLMTYPHNETTDTFVLEAKYLLAQHGIKVDEVSIGGTKQLWQSDLPREATEYRAGTYVYGDVNTVKCGVMDLDDCALLVITTVVSCPTIDRVIVDAGSKSLSSDGQDIGSFGFVMEHPKAHLYGLSEEHGQIDFSRCKARPEIGERLTVIPNHCCVVSNLWDQVIGIRNARAEIFWQVAARGAVQ